MKMQIKEMHLENFKGVTDKTYKFGILTKILGMNGIGKSTIATAWYWLTNDKSYDLASNPNIRPDDGRECVPTVTAIIDIDGVETTITKMQKQKKSKPDDNGLVKVSLTNSYEINSVPKSERDFKTYLEEKGIDFKIFLVCSHPNVFTSQKAKEMRELLFKMASAKTDVEIAQLDTETANVAELLTSYKYEEIEAMQKASKKKADEQIKDIPNQIIGLEKAKVDIDTAEQELAKRELERKISEIDNKINSTDSGADALMKESMDLQFGLSGIITAMNKVVDDKRRELELKKHDAETRAYTAGINIESKEHAVELNKSKISSAESERKKLGEQYKAELAKEFDSTPYIFDNSKWVFGKNDKICSHCGQPLPKKSVEANLADFTIRKEKAEQDMKCKCGEAKASFDTEKKTNVKRIVNAGTEKKDLVKDLTEENEKILAEISTLKADISKAQADQKQLEQQLTELPAEVDYTTNADYVAKRARLTEIEQSIANLKDTTSIKDSLLKEKAEINAELDKVKDIISQASNNVRIDEQITELKGKQLDYEQAKADAEKILYQLRLVSEKKENLLTEEINSHFSMVKWQLFSELKKGERVPDCIPKIGGKEFGVSTNTGREIIAKLDICNGFQKFFNMQVPIFLDGAESLNDFNMPKLDCQVITLNVTNDTELKVEVE